MNALILLLFAADPTGLRGAFESAETVDLSYDWTGFKVTLVNPETIKKFAPLVEVKGEAHNLPAKAGVLTPEVIRVTIRGKKATEFWMVESYFVCDEKLFTFADDKLWVVLRAYFEPPRVVPEPRKPGILGELPGDRRPDPPTVEESVQKSLTAAMKSAEKLDITHRRVKIEYPAGGDSIRNVHLNNLKITGNVTQNAKKPEDAVEIVFVNKETRIPIYLVGDTAYWGDKRWKSVKLTRDSMWKQMARIVPTPENAGLKPDPDDAAGLKAAIESADSIEATRVGGETEQFKGNLTLKKEDFKDWGKFGLVIGKPASYYGKDTPDAIEIVVMKGKDSRKFRLIGDTLIFDKDRSIKMENSLLYMNLILKLQKTNR